MASIQRTLLPLFVALLAHTVAHAQERKQDYSVTVSYPSDAITLDPTQQLNTMNLQVANLLFDPLVRTDKYNGLQPRLAQRWEQIGSTRIRFHLRKRVKFHSGNPFTAKDVEFSFNRLKVSKDFKGIFAPYKKLEVVDDYTVDLVAHQPTPYSIMMYNASYIFVLDHRYYQEVKLTPQEQKEIERNGGTFASGHISGTGAFMLKERLPGRKTVYVKNPNYWGVAGNIQKLTIEPVADNSKRTVALLFGNVDMVYPIAPTHFEYVENSKHHKLLKIPGDRVLIFQMNQKVVPAFRDWRVRQAVTYAVDNVGIVQRVLKGFGTPAAQLSPKGFVGHNAALTPRYNLTKAKQLMKKAGYENGFVVNMIAPNDRYLNDKEIAQNVAAMLAKINIRVNLVTMPKSQYWPKFDECKLGMQMIGWSTDTGDSANYSEYLTERKSANTGYGAHNCNGYSNPRINELLALARSTVDDKKRAAYLQEVSRIEYEQALYVPLHWEDLAWGYTDTFHNFEDIVNVDNFPYFGDLVVRY